MLWFLPTYWGKSNPAFWQYCPGSCSSGFLKKGPGFTWFQVSKGFFWVAQVEKPWKVKMFVSDASSLYIESHGRVPCNGASRWHWNILIPRFLFFVSLHVKFLGHIHRQWPKLIYYCYRIVYIFHSLSQDIRNAYLLFLLANIHNLSFLTNLNTFDISVVLPFPLSRFQSIVQRSNPLITSTVYQYLSSKRSLEGGISEMRCVIRGDDDEQRVEMVRFSVLL